MISGRESATEAGTAIPGKFIMGSPVGEGAGDEQPQREIAIGYRLAVGRFPVTFEEWDVCYADGGAKNHPKTDWGRGRQPAINASWTDITRDYLPWLNRKLDLSEFTAYRLLTEAEWEYCCRAGTKTAYSFGDHITSEQALFSEVEPGSTKQTIEVGTFPGNAWGLHDMHGNVWEWCQDAYVDNYTEAPKNGTSVDRTGKKILRVLRGGSWDNLPQNLRSADRDGGQPVIRYPNSGFRLARTLNA